MIRPPPFNTKKNGGSLYYLLTRRFVADQYHDKHERASGENHTATPLGVAQTWIKILADLYLQPNFFDDHTWN